MNIGRHVKYLLFLSYILMKFDFSGQIFAHYSNIKYHESRFIMSQVVPCGQT